MRMKQRKKIGFHRGMGPAFCLFLTLAMSFWACVDKDNNNGVDNNNNKNPGNNGNNPVELELFLPLSDSPNSEQTQSFVPFLDDSYPEATPKQLEQLDRIKKRKTTKSI
ncbi:MAG: hypothetical protein FWC28_04145, partial [Proteobacteria bacterium]|nr:hypothetical protein [Pseudomonadota bacterium]